MVRRLIAGITAAMFVSLAAVEAQDTRVSGTATYRERIALPPGAVLEATLEDVSRPDRPSEIVARATQQVPASPPIAYDLPYESHRIDPRHRYIVRLRIMDGDRVLFESADPALVVTQGHSSRANVTLVSVSPVRPAPVAAASTGNGRAVRPMAPLPPAVALGTLPATFAGTLPCADCAGIRYELNLFPDDSFLLRTTRMTSAGRESHDDMGSWVLSSDRRAIALRGASGVAGTFAIRDSGTIRKIDEPNAASGPSHDLRRTSTFRPLEIQARMSGAYRVLEGEAEFTECATGQTWTVLDRSAHTDLQAAYRNAGRRDGQSVSVTIDGRLETRARGTRPGVESVLVVERMVETLPSGSCARRFAALPLEGTTWRLTRLDGVPVALPPNAASAAALTFRAEPSAFSASGGCNRFTGPYRLEEDTLTFNASGTMMVCPGLSPTETSFKSALGETRRYRILGNVLELYDGQRQLLARFEGR